MGINFETPIVLWLLLGNLFFLWVPRKVGKEKRHFYTGLRMLVFSLLVIGLAGISFIAETIESHTILLIDQSDSMTVQSKEITEFINESLGEKTENDYVEIISFGEGYGIEQLMTNDQFIYKPQSVIDKRGTNLEEALVFAINRLDQDKNKRIVLVSDFEETSGDLLSRLLETSIETIEFKHYQPIEKDVPDTQIVSVEMPKNIRKGERFPVAVSVYAQQQTSAVLSIYNDDQIVVQKTIDLKPGVQRFVFEDQLVSTGGHQYVAQIEAANDAVEQNNRWHNIIEVEGPPVLLMVDPKNEGDTYKQLLTQQGFQITHYNQTDADYTLEALAAYDAVILVNTSIEEVTLNFLASLELYVKELGGGLLVVGGSESYAVGGYEETVLEQLLPVNMALKVDGERYDLAMMVVVDKSGSMSGGDHGPSKMQMAKEAVIRVAKTLSVKDQLGLIAFDNQPYEVFPLSAVTEIEDMAKKVAGVKADGGTSILPALEGGLKMLDESALKGKHLLLVSDGQGERRGYDALIQNYPNVSISTITIGEDADSSTMKRIAEYGNGRFYQVLDYRRIPEIFTKETRLAMDEFIKEGNFVPEKNSHHPMLSQVLQVPLLYGYVGTTIKPQAELLLSVEEEPLLATWQYGLGKTMAWTSDVNSWVQAYYGQSQGIQLLTDMPSEVLSSQDYKSLQLDTSMINNQLQLSGVSKEDKALEFSVMTASGDVSIIDTDQYSDGYFEGDLVIPEEGFLFLRVLDKGTNQLVQQVPIAVNYSKEYDLTNERSILKGYADALASQKITLSSEVFTEIQERTSAEKSYGDWAVVLALILFVVDIGFRKLRFDPIQRIMSKKQSIKKMSEKEAQVVPTAMNKEEVSAVKPPASEIIDTGRLLSKKRKRD